MLNITKNIGFKYILNNTISKYKNINKNHIIKSYYSTTTTVTTDTPIITLTNVQLNNNKEIERIQEEEEEEYELDEEEILELENKIKENEIKFKETQDKISKINQDQFNLEFEEPQKVDFFNRINSLTVEDKNSSKVFYEEPSSLLFSPYKIFYKTLNGGRKKRFKSINTDFNNKKFDFLPTCNLTNLFSWDSKESQLYLLNFIARKKNFSNLDDWYKADFHEIDKEYGISILLNYYQNGIFEVLFKIYNNHNWDISKFKKIQIQNNFYNSHVLLKSLKETGYISRIEDLTSLQKSKTLKPKLPYYLFDIIRSNLRGYGFSSLSKYSVDGFSLPISFWLKSTNTERINLTNHLSLYLINGKQYRENVSKEEKEKGDQSSQEFNEKIEGELYPSESLVLDETRIYDLDFFNTKPYLIGNSILITIRFIFKVHPYIKPWLFKYQDETSEYFVNSKYLIGYIEKKFNINSPEDWYSLSYSKELKEILPEKWYYHSSFLEFLKARYPDFTFDINKFKDENLFSHLFESGMIKKVREMVEEKIESIAPTITDKQEQFDLLAEDKEFIKMVRDSGLKFRVLSELIQKLYPKELAIKDGIGSKIQGKIVVNNSTELSNAVKQIVESKNLTMEDLYTFNFNNFISNHNCHLKNYMIIPKIYPNYNFIILLFGPRIKLEPEKYKEYSDQYFKHLLDLGLIKHPLDLFAYLNSDIKDEKYSSANRRLIQYGYINILIKEHCGLEFTHEAAFKSNLIVRKNFMDMSFRNYLGLKIDEDIGMQITNSTYFTKLSDHLKLTNNVD